MVEPAQKKTRCERTILLSSESVNEGHPDKVCDLGTTARYCAKQEVDRKVAEDIDRRIKKVDERNDKAANDKVATEDKVVCDKVANDKVLGDTVRRTKEEIKEMEGHVEEVVVDNDSESSRVM